ncbi:MAG: alkaline phosphatase [Acidobacteria bacterium]|nr:MAG: alkaline phosphatase [Acidobacteriota bacterium]PYU45334.1 MAG: alkaline phosphatase [Acidobacteriota bacterium]PYU57596.1 MAG: alkaline phosphatase [Acidobacteriota bacterium]PYU63640.1 MAG: alkaline phosphatase [Acidobacteriota bacterium]PYU73936.1 MAG: alkaline phosphatase [Acidobacteriota bacterium]
MQKHFWGIGLIVAAEALATLSPCPAILSSATPPADQSAILVGAGDIADCKDLSGAEATAKLLQNVGGTVMAVGDLAYPDGSKENFTCYDKTWGRAKSRTRPAPGNHEFHAAGAAPYFNYFGAEAGDPKTGYYSYELGTWHIIVLNSECRDVGGCEAGSPQERWLRADLAAHPAACTLAYWHRPLFSSGSAHGNDLTVKPLFQALYQANADIVVGGHDHDYERFAPQTPAGVADPQRGIREFVVGTGGKNHRPFGAPRPNSELRDATAFGVLKLTLRPGAYDWQFIPETGKSFTDSGSGKCH